MEGTLADVCLVCSADPDCCRRVDRLIAHDEGWKVGLVTDPTKLRATIEDETNMSTGRAALVLDLTSPGTSDARSGDARHDALARQVATLVALVVRAPSVPTLAITTLAPLTEILAEHGIPIAAQVAPRDTDRAWRQALNRLLASSASQMDTPSACEAPGTREGPGEGLPPRMTLREHPPLHWERSAGTLISGDQEIPLTPREHALLDILAQAPGRTFSAAELGGLVARPGQTYGVGAHAVVQALSELRRKLGDDSAPAPLLICRRGFGYMLMLPPA